MKSPAKNYITSDLFTAHWGESLQSAFDKMKRHNIRHLPVIDDSGVIVGILSNRDLQRGMSVQADERFPTAHFDPAATVKDYMSYPVHTVPANSGLNEVAKSMVLNKISSVLLTEGKQVIGIITHEDLLLVLVGLLDRSVLPKNLDRLAYNSQVGQIAQLLSQAGI